MKYPLSTSWKCRVLNNFLCLVSVWVSGQWEDSFTPLAINLHPHLSLFVCLHPGLDMFFLAMTGRTTTENDSVLYEEPGEGEEEEDIVLEEDLTPSACKKEEKERLQRLLAKYNQSSLMDPMKCKKSLIFHPLVDLSVWYHTHILITYLSCVCLLHFLLPPPLLHLLICHFFISLLLLSLWMCLKRNKR